MLNSNLLNQRSNEKKQGGYANRHSAAVGQKKNQKQPPGLLIPKEHSPYQGKTSPKAKI